MTTKTPTAMPPYGIRNGTTLEQPPDQSCRTRKGKILSEFYFRETALDRSIALQWFNQAINRPRRIGIKISILSMYSLNDCKNCRTFALPLSEANIFRLKTIVAEPYLIVPCLDVIVFLSEHND